MIHVVAPQDENGVSEERDRLTRVQMASPTDWNRIAPAVTFIRPSGQVLVAFAALDDEHREAAAHLYYSPMAPGDDLAALHQPRGDVVPPDAARADGAARGVRVGHAVVWDDAVVQIDANVGDEDLSYVFEAAMGQMTEWYPLADEAPVMGAYGLLGAS